MPDSTRKNIVNLSRTIRPYGGEMTFAMVCALFKQGSVIGAAAVTSYIAGTALGGGDLSHIKKYVVILAVCILLRALGYYGEMYYAHDVAFRVIRNFRLNIYNKLSEISPAYTLRKQTGQIGQAFVADVEILELFLAHTFSSFIIAFIITVGVVIALLFIHPVFSLLVAAAAVILVSVPYSMNRQAEKKGKLVRESLAEANVMMVESVQGLKELTMLGAGKRRVREVSETMKKLYGEQYEYGRLKGRESMAIQIICGLFTAGIMIAAAVLVRNGSMDKVMYPVAVMLSTVILGPVLDLTAVAQELGIVFAASNRVQDLLEEEPKVTDSGTLDAADGPVSLEFCDVSFGYNGSEETVLSHVDFAVKPGETAVLVGHSGAGKTTCSNLLLRYWDPDEGSVRINGTDLREYRIGALREMVSAASQETYLFHVSVADNIRMGAPEASDDAVVRAAVNANADSFIRNLPQGYDTVTGERGYRLSGGERQRIAIARTLLCDSPVVILDESVSNLDTENELYIQHILKERLKKKTVIMIAHRLSTILAADKIIVMEDGRVAAAGTHEELLGSCEAYRELIRNQLQEERKKQKEKVYE